MITVTYPLKNTELLPETTAKLIEESFSKTRSEDDRVEVLCDYCDSVHMVVGRMADDATDKCARRKADSWMFYGIAVLFIIVMGIVWLTGGTAEWAGPTFVIVLTAGLGAMSAFLSKVYGHYAKQLEKIHKSVPHKF